MDLKEAQQLVDDLEPKIERLKSLYQQYFMGIEKIPPHVLRKDVERTIFRMRRSKLQNTRIRFKFQQLVQRYNTYDQYWGRIMRQIEKGTYKRDLRRAAKRFGQDEALEIAGRKDRAALKGIEDEEPQEAGPPVYELPDPDGFEIDLGFDEDDMPTPPSRRSPRPAPQAYHAQEVWDPGDLYSDPSPQSAPMPSADPYAHQRQAAYPAQPQGAHYPQGQPSYHDAVPAPVGTHPGYPPPPATQQRSGYPSQNPPVPLTPREPLPAPGPEPAPAPRASRPRGGGALFGGKARRSNAGAPPPQPRPAPPQPHQAQPQAAPPEASPAPQPPRRPGAPPSRPPPPAPRRPGAPPRRPPPPAPGGRGPQRPVPAPPAQAPASPPAPRPPPAQRPQRPTAKGDDRTRAVYDEYMRARQRTGKGANVSYDAMRKSLEKQANQLRKRHGSNRKVDFEVVEKDGKPLIRPVVK